MKKMLNHEFIMLDMKNGDFYLNEIVKIEKLINMILNHDYKKYASLKKMLLN